MKREGAVRISRSKVLRVTDGEEAAVVLGKAAAAVKPTNASKNVGGKCRRPRCAGCHLHHNPAMPTKSRDKAKGAHKLRACDVALNHRLVSWRVVDGGGRVPDYKGASASAVLAYLAGSSSSGSSWYEDDDDGALEAAPPASSGLYDLIVGCHAAAAPAGEEADLARPTDIQDTDAIEEQEQDEEEEFFMVGITIALEFSDGEEDWIVVEEI